MPHMFVVRAMKSIAALVLVVVAPGCLWSKEAPAPPLTCDPIDYAVAPRAAFQFYPGSYDAGSGTPAPLELQTEGDTLFFTDGLRIFRVDSRPPVPVTSGNEPLPRADGSMAPAGGTIDKFWVEKTRFVIGRIDGLWALPRDGSPAALIADFGIGYVLTAWDKDDANVYLGSIYGDAKPGVYRVPLAGGSIEYFAPLPVDVRSVLLFHDATHVYAFHDSLTSGAGVTSIAKDGSAATALQLAPFEDMLGFDGTAFYVTRRQPVNGTLDVDRDLPGGSSARVWVGGADGDLSLQSFAAADFLPVADGGYVSGLLRPSNGAPETTKTGVVRLKADAAPVVVGCADVGHPFLHGPPAVGASAVYWIASEDDPTTGADSTWSIVRFKR